MDPRRGLIFMDGAELNRIIIAVEKAYRQENSCGNKRISFIYPDRIRKLMKKYAIGMQCEVCLNKKYHGRYCCAEHGHYYRSITDSFFGKIYPYELYGARISAHTFPLFKVACAFCGRKKNWTRMSIDHIVPISKGGLEFDKSNLQFACLKCNIKKGNRLQQ